MENTKNVKARVEGSKLFLEIDLEQRLGTSASGKSVTVASTVGNKEIPGTNGIVLGLNCYVPAGK